MIYRDVNVCDLGLSTVLVDVQPSFQGCQSALVDVSVLGTGSHIAALYRGQLCKEVEDT